MPRECRETGLIYGQILTLALACFPDLSSNFRPQGSGLSWALGPEAWAWA